MLININDDIVNKFITIYEKILTADQIQPIIEADVNQILNLHFSEESLLGMSHLPIKMESEMYKNGVKYIVA